MAVDGLATGYQRVGHVKLYEWFSDVEVTMAQYNIHVVKAHLSELIQRAMMGEEVII